MKEMWPTLFMAVLTIAVPILTTYIVSLINKLAAHLEAKTKSIKEKDFIEDVAKTVELAVKVVNQTYVNRLKANDVFTTAAQEEAMKKAIDVCITTLKPVTLHYLSETYDDVKTYLKHFIEAEVFKQKQAQLISSTTSKSVDTTPAKSVAQAADAAKRADSPTPSNTTKPEDRPATITHTTEPEDAPTATAQPNT